MKNKFLLIVLFLLTGLGGWAQAPNISYTASQTYTTGTAITALTPTNTGGAVSSAGVQVSTFAGSGTAGSTNGTGTAASFNSPWGVATDASGNVYVVDQFNNQIRKISPAGVVTTFAGTGDYGSNNGIATSATFSGPQGIATDKFGNVYVADSGNQLIRKISSAGIVTTFAGSGSIGSANGTGTAASFNWPTSLATDAAGNVYVADINNSLIRKISPAGEVTTLAGGGGSGSLGAGSSDGIGTAASFNYPYGVALDAAGNVYVTAQPKTQSHSLSFEDGIDLTHILIGIDTEKFFIRFRGVAKPVGILTWS